MFFMGKLFLAILIAVVGLFCSFGLAWIWLSNEQIPNLITATHGLTFDYIIVGAGTSGSVLAHELSQHSNLMILLIEAGHTFSPLSKIPLLATVLQKSQNDWGFMSEPQQFSSKGLINQMQSHTRGKGLGGSSQLNYMLHFSGNQNDFESWKSMGINGWTIRNHTNIHPPRICSRISFTKSLIHDVKKPKSLGHDFCQQSSNEHNRKDKPKEIWTVPQNYSRLSEAFVKTSSHFQDELNFNLEQYNIKNGLRWSVYEKFLRPCFGRKNLKILSNTLVMKIVTRGHDAKAVVVQSSNNPTIQYEIFARNEIILSAGSFQSPQLLQVSGIGPKNVLGEIGVKKVHISPNVGLNLHDHFNLPLFVSINESASLTVRKVLSLKEIVKYLVMGQGHFANFGVIGHVTSKSDHSGVRIFATGAIDETALMAVSNFKREDFRSLFPLYHNASQEGFVILSTCLQPLSRGYVEARTSKIENSPFIDPNYVHNPNDIDCMIRGIRTAIRIVESVPFRQLNATIHWPKIKSCSNYGPFNRDLYTNQPSDRYLECLIRTVGLSGHHPGGTCSMGSSTESALDNKLRVRGVKRLRVVDASVLPTPISGTPNSVLVSIAKHAAKLILRQIGV